MLIGGSNAPMPRAVVGAENGPARNRLTNVLVVPANDVGGGTGIGISDALNNIERQQSNEQVLLPPRRWVGTAYDVSVKEDHQLSVRLTAEEQRGRLPLFEGWPCRTARTIVLRDLQSWHHLEWLPIQSWSLTPCFPGLGWSFRTVAARTSAQDASFRLLGVPEQEEPRYIAPRGLPRPVNRRGVPVPYVAANPEELGEADTWRVGEVERDRLCQVCGLPITWPALVVFSLDDRENWPEGRILDGLIHQSKCAPLAFGHCPYLRRRHGYELLRVGAGDVGPSLDGHLTGTSDRKRLRLGVEHFL